MPTGSQRKKKDKEPAPAAVQEPPAAAPEAPPPAPALPEPEDVGHLPEIVACAGPPAADKHAAADLPEEAAEEPLAPPPPAEPKEIWVAPADKILLALKNNNLHVDMKLATWFPCAFGDRAEGKTPEADVTVDGCKEVADAKVAAEGMLFSDEISWNSKKRGCTIGQAGIMTGMNVRVASIKKGQFACAIYQSPFDLADEEHAAQQHGVACYVIGVDLHLSNNKVVSTNVIVQNNHVGQCVIV